MSDREHDHAIHDRANAIMADILAALEPTRTASTRSTCCSRASANYCRLKLADRGIGILAAKNPGEPVQLGPVEIAILTNGAARLLREFATADAEQTVHLERTLVSKPPAILH